jgi:hypothetical protein
MRKNVVLSFLAVTSASMGAYANADLSSFIPTANSDLLKWTSATDKQVSLESGLFTATDKTVTLSQTIKDLLPGSYQLTTTTNTNVKITINGTEYTDGKFTISSQQDVEIKAVSKNGTAGFAVGGFTLTLIFDFATTENDLAYNLNAVIDKIVVGGANYDALHAEGALIMADINTIKDDKGADSYTVYKNFQLYPGGNNTIQPRIDTFSAKVNNDNAYQAALTAVTEMKASLAAAKSNLDAATAYSKGKYQKAYDDINTTISTFSTTADAAFTAGTAGTLKTTETTTSVSASIATLNSNIATADQNDADYNIVALQITTVNATYNTALQNLSSVLSGDVYKDKLTAAQTELGVVLKSIAAVVAANGTSDNHDGATASKDQNLTVLGTASDNIAIINTNYTNEATGLKASYATALSDLNALKANLAAVDITGVTTVTSDISTINGNISTLSSQIEAANTAHTITALDYTALKTTISNEIIALSTKVANFNANVATTTTLNALLKKLTDAEAAVKVLKSKDGNYTVGTKYATTESSLQNTIGTSTGTTGYFGAAKAAYDNNNGDAVTYATNSAASFTATSAAIDAYQAMAINGVAAYDQIADSIAGYNAELTKLKTTVVIPAVSTTDGSTYAAKISDISTAIAGFSTDLTTALGKTDESHYNALIALQGRIVTTYYTDVNALCSAYPAQETIYKAAANTTTATTMKSDASNRVTALAGYLDALPDTYTPEKIGVSNTKFNSRLSALKQRVADQQMIITATNPATDAINTIATISDVNTALAKITVDENNLKLYGDSAIANVNQKSTADTKVSGLISTLNAISNGTDPNKTNYFAGLKSTQLSHLTDESIIISTSYQAETLVADWTKTILAKLTSISDTIGTISTAVTAANTNYSAKTTQEGAVTAAGFANLISTATNDVNSVTSGAGATYYINVLAGYAQQATQIGTDITSYYNAGTSSQYTSEITTRINSLKTSINEVKALAQANDVAYQAQVAVRQKVQNYFLAVYSDISTQDKSTKADDYLSELTTLQQTTLNTLNSKVDSIFGQGQSSAQDAAIQSGYTVINASIKDVNDRRVAEYDAAIAADNLDKYTNIKNIVSATQKAYNSAVTTINNYSNIKNANYKVGIDSIVAANKDIYTYAAKITDLSNSIDSAYASTVSPALFDISVFTTTATTYQTNINSRLTTFRDSANVVAKSYFDTADSVATGKLTAAQTILTNKGYATAVVDAAFSDVQTMISNAETKRRNSPDFALDLDDILTDYATIDAKLVAGYEPAAVAQWNSYQTALNTQIKTWRSSITGYNLADYTASFNAKIGQIQSVYATATADSLAGTLYPTNLGTIISNLDGYKNEASAIVANALNAYNTKTANDQAYTAMIKQIEIVQTALNSAKDYVAWYCSSDQLASTISISQSNIDALTATANDKANASTNKTTVLDACTSLSTSIQGIYATANSFEIGVLGDKINILKTDFNSALAALNVGANDSRVAPYQTKIDGYKTTLVTITTNYSTANTVAKQQGLRTQLVNLEQSIATTHTDLINIYNPSLVSSILTSLNSAIKKVDNNYNGEVTYLAGCDAKVKAAYSLDAIGAAITAAKDSISHRNNAGMLLFYSDNISGYISSIATNLSTVTAAIGAMQDKITANNNAYASLTGQIGDINTRLASVIDVISSYKYTYTYNLTDINTMISAATDDVNAQYAAGTLTSASPLLKKADINSAIDQLEKDAAHNEATHLIGDLSTAWNSADSILIAQASVYTSTISSALWARYNAIGSAITALSTYDDQAYTGFISQDIDGNAILDANNLQTTKSVNFIDVFNSEIATKITALNGDIASLNADADYKLGDVTNDGSVLVDDYNTIKGYVLAPTTAPTSGRAFNTADVNKDGNINIGDVTAVANIIINRGSAASARAMRVAAVASTDAITLSSASEGTTQRIAINLKNTVAYVACQMDIKLPAGMTLVGESLSDRANGHTLSSNDLSDGSHRVVISTVENNNFNDSESAILYLDVNTTSSSDIDKVSVSNIMFTDANARVYNFADLTSGSATGINGVKADQGIGSKIYSVGGKLLNTLQKGVNIIRKADGSTKKIINK